MPAGFDVDDFTISVLQKSVTLNCDCFLTDPYYDFRYDREVAMMKSMNAVLALVAISMASTGAFAAEFLVKYKNAAGLGSIMETARVRMNTMQVLDRHAPGQFVKVKVAKSAEARTLAELSANPNIEWVTPNFKLEAYRTPVSATALRTQWAMGKVQAEKAWQRAGNKGKRDVIVAIIDTGVDYRHPALAPNMIAGYDFAGNDADPMDETSSSNPGHGTHCTGAVGATGLVDGGTVGMGPGLSLMPIRFLDKNGSGDLNNGIKAIDFAIQKGVHVISASWGASVPRAQAAALIEAVQRADAAGLIFVAAAANDGANNDSKDVFPANANTENMIAVAASGESDAKPQWSNYGKAMVHLASPGENIMSTLPNNAYGNLSGTSMATPLVAGLVGFLKSQDPNLTGKQIRALLQTTGAKVSIETACNCRVDAFNAVDHLLSKKPWVVPAAASLEINGTVNVSMVNGIGPFQYASSNASVLSVDTQGVAKGLAQGTATIMVTDANGAKVSSLDYNVGQVASGPAPGDCPIGDVSLCEAACGIMPDLPFCQK